MKLGAQDTTEMKDEYAFGCWEKDGRECPIQSAGIERDGIVDDVARQYDRNVEELVDYVKFEGIVDGTVAKKAIKMTKQDLEMRCSTGGDQMYVDVCDEVLESEFQN